MKLSHALEPARNDMAAAIRASIGRVAQFARKHGWGDVLHEPMLERIEVHGSQRRLWSRVKQLEGLAPETPIPSSGLSAALLGKTLIITTPAAFRRLRPEYDSLSESWSRLAAHELAHEVHRRIVGGNPDDMGPMWFYEGLAMMVSGMDRAAHVRVASLEEAIQATRAVGRSAYFSYGAAVRYFARHCELKELIRNAAAPGFEGWLAEQCACRIR